MAAVAAEYEGQVTFIGIAGHGEVAAMQQFVSDTGTGALTHLVDDDGSRWQRFGVVTQPAFAFVGADGVARTVPGSLEPDALRAETDALLG